MSEVPINYLAVLVAAVANMVLGFLWFGPVFGKTWARLAGFTPERMKEAQQQPMTMSYVLMTIGSLVMAYVLAHSIAFASAYTGVTGASAGLMAAAWSWIGFVAPVSIGAVLWENKSWSYWALTFAYYLGGLLVMGVILSVWA
jgi:hypothetical protein